MKNGSFIYSAVRTPIGGFNGALSSMAAPDLAAARDDLLLAGIEVLPLEAYDRIVEMEDEACRLGYPRVA